MSTGRAGFTLPVHWLGDEYGWQLGVFERGSFQRAKVWWGQDGLLWPAGVGPSDLPPVAGDGADAAE